MMLLKWASAKASACSFKFAGENLRNDRTQDRRDSFQQTVSEEW